MHTYRHTHICTIMPIRIRIHRPRHTHICTIMPIRIRIHRPRHTHDEDMTPAVQCITLTYMYNYFVCHV